MSSKKELIVTANKNFWPKNYHREVVVAGNWWALDEKKNFLLKKLFFEPHLGALNSCPIPNL